MSRWDKSQPFPAMAQVPDLSIALHTRYLRFGEPSDSYVRKWFSKKKIHRQLDDVIGEFPFLAQVQWDATDTPYRLVIEATHSVLGSKFRDSLSSTTRYILPTWDTSLVELDVWLYREAKLLKTYRAVGSYRTKRHLLLALLPMMWHSKVPGNTMEDTFRDLFLQIQQEADTLFTASGR